MKPCTKSNIDVSLIDMFFYLFQNSSLDLCMKACEETMKPDQCPGFSLGKDQLECVIGRPAECALVVPKRHSNATKVVYNKELYEKSVGKLKTINIVLKPLS